MSSAAIIIMGVAGSGKSTMGALLAQALNLPFVDGDTLQPAANKAKMASGTPLDDQDRAPWLEAVATALAQGPKVIACSALKRRYRDRLRAAAPRTRFIFLAGSRDTLLYRLAHRQHEYMPRALLDSQLADLEVPEESEGVLTLSIEHPPAALVQAAVASLSR
jgi:gluconokinase